ncbi:MAG: hypothetical protein IKU26_00255 [Clostridia bacterium]|nr:hypothetical protein [Clostridia bacterium]
MPVLLDSNKTILNTPVDTGKPRKVVFEMKLNGWITILALIIILMPVAGVYLLALAAPAGKLLGVPMLVVGIILWALVFSDFGRREDYV